MTSVWLYYMYWEAGPLLSFFNGIYWYIKNGEEYQLAQQTYIQIKSYARVQGYYNVLTQHSN